MPPLDPAPMSAEEFWALMGSLRVSPTEIFDADRLTPEEWAVAVARVLPVADEPGR